jgi:hypothetical protein
MRNWLTKFGFQEGIPEVIGDNPPDRAGIGVQTPRTSLGFVSFLSAPFLGREVVCVLT